MVQADECEQPRRDGGRTGRMPVTAREQPSRLHGRVEVESRLLVVMLLLAGT
jgi:hypothetical protein